MVEIAPIVDSNGLAVANTYIKPSKTSDVMIVIPKGWAPAILESGTVNSLPGQSGKVAGILPANQWYKITEEQINQGIVIVNGTSNYEEYVWVPIPISNFDEFSRVAWKGPYVQYNVYIGSSRVSGAGGHPLGDSDNESGYYYEETTTTEYNNMLQSLMTWNGFYIGRYEASQKSSTVAQSKRDGNPWTNVSQENAITYSANSSISNMHLIRGIEWDYVLKWLIGNARITSANVILTEEHVQTDSTAWGNYPNSTSASSNSSSVRTTGYSEYWKANNIYDLAGNVYEWTQEYYGVINSMASTMATARGGAAMYRP